MIEIAVCEDEQPIREYIKRLTEQFADVVAALTARDVKYVFLVGRKS